MYLNSYSLSLISRRLPKEWSEDVHLVMLIIDNQSTIRQKSNIFLKSIITFLLNLLDFLHPGLSDIFPSQNSLSTKQQLAQISFSGRVPPQNCNKAWPKMLPALQQKESNII